MTTTAFPTAAAFKAGQEYVHSVKVHNLDNASYVLAAAFRITYRLNDPYAPYGAGPYILEGNFITQKPGDGPWGWYLPQDAHVREYFSTYTQAKKMAAYFRQKSKYCGQVMASRLNRGS